MCVEINTSITYTFSCSWGLYWWGYKLTPRRKQEESSKTTRCQADTGMSYSDKRKKLLKSLENHQKSRQVCHYNMLLFYHGYAYSNGLTNKHTLAQLYYRLLYNYICIILKTLIIQKISFHRPYNLFLAEKFPVAQ